MVSIDGVCYNAFQTENNGFLLYIKRDKFTKDTFRAEVYVKTDDVITNVLITELKVPEVYE